MEDMIKLVEFSDSVMNNGQVIFLDTETTGLNPPRDKIVEIAIIDSSGTILLNTLVNPVMTIPESVRKIHGIDDAMVQGERLLEDILPEVRDIFLSNPHVVIYNADFDTRFFPAAIWKDITVTCCMKAFIHIYEELEGHYSSKRFPLSKAYNVSTGRKIQELGKSHRALTDCLACSAVWNWCTQKRSIIDDPNWAGMGYEVYCSHCRRQTFHKYRPRYREGFNRYYQCLECLKNNISESQMVLILDQIKSE